jgi:hypothetical protein
VGGEVKRDGAVDDLGNVGAFKGRESANVLLPVANMKGIPLNRAVFIGSHN